MPNDMMIYTMHGLIGLIRRGIVVPLGGQRFQFTKDYTHQPEYNHPTKAYLQPIRPPVWSVTSGTIFNIIDLSSPEPAVQKANNQVHCIMFEVGSALAAYYGGAQYYTGGEGVQSPVHDLSVPTATTFDKGRFYTGGDRVGLRGRGIDADTVVTYSWAQTSGPVVDIINSDKQEAYFIAPYVFETSVLVFRFTVNDGVQSAYSDLSIRVKP